MTLTSLKTVKYWHGYLNGIHSQTVNQDLSNNDINSTGLELVKGFQVIGDKDARELQIKILEKVGEFTPFKYTLFHT